MVVELPPLQHLDDESTEKHPERPAAEEKGVLSFDDSCGCCEVGDVGSKSNEIDSVEDHTATVEHEVASVLGMPNDLWHDEI